MKQDNKITLLAGICSLALLGFSPQMYATNKAELSMSVQQTKKITGTVSDSQGAIIGATVKVKGTSNGAVTDMDGKFSINAPVGATIEVSYIGYITKSFKVGNQSNVNITLTEDNQNLDEVVVVGYGTMKKSDLAGASA
ncbi:MAG: carboxypeptidase-like regulatory domain-containing protein, partial [Candidatus Gastranaerophilaceae bacterium]|nr:carboxypeptidase-like regulatory domain-containing protein [Candidatus Gastranaerophilaceae bacterium]